MDDLRLRGTANTLRVFSEHRSAYLCPLAGLEVLLVRLETKRQQKFVPD
jgi:hypothetical protein